MTSRRANHTQSKESHQAEDRQCRQHHTNNPKNSTGVGRTAARGVHYARIHVLEVCISHYPGRYGREDAAERQAQDAKHEDKYAAMWFHFLV